MEATENIQGRLRNGRARQGVLHSIGDDRVARALASGDDRRAGMARLLLMVDTVLPRLTAVEDRPSEI